MRSVLPALLLLAACGGAAAPQTTPDAASSSVTVALGLCGTNLTRSLPGPEVLLAIEALLNHDTPNEQKGRCFYGSSADPTKGEPFCCERQPFGSGSEPHGERFHVLAFYNDPLVPAGTYHFKGRAVFMPALDGCAEPTFEAQ